VKTFLHTYFFNRRAILRLVLNRISKVKILLFIQEGVMLGFLLKFIFLFLRVNGSNSFPDPLPAEEEKRCFLLSAKGDEKAREKLIIHNLRLVAHIVKKYYSNFKEQDDLISIGTIGLIKAIDSFNAEKGARFATYAGKCIQNAILS